jgi:hypothetical protein
VSRDDRSYHLTLPSRVLFGTSYISLVCYSSPVKQNKYIVQLDRSIASTLISKYHTTIRARSQKAILITIMPGSKFVEILDTTATPYSQANVDLQATIDESRRRSASSSGSISSSSESLSSVQSPTSPTSPTTTAQPIKMRLRAFSLRRPNKT